MEKRNRGEPATKASTMDEFLERVGEGMNGVRPVNLPEAARAVFRTLSRHVGAGQIVNLLNALPEKIRMFWLEASGADERKL
jgi:uncharacterized protein (DUF2267 family)